MFTDVQIRDYKLLISGKVPMVLISRALPFKAVTVPNVSMFLTVEGAASSMMSRHSTLPYDQQRRNDYSLEVTDWDGRLQDSFFTYVKRTPDYDKNEVPWENGDNPVQVQMSAYLR